MSTDSPQDSLQHYFDDLLLDDDGSGLQPQVKEVPAQEEPQAALDYQERLRDKELQARKKLAKLLSTAPQTADVEVAVEASVEVALETDTAPDIDVDEKGAVEVEEKVQVEDKSADAPVELVTEELDQQATEDMLSSLTWLDNGRPRWGQERFDVLLFSVSGLTLAVPLIALGQIQPLTDELTPLFGQADWFMGLQPTAMGKIRTVNTAKFVMPERYDDAFLETAKYVISIDGLPWGLAVDAVNQPITLEPEDVKWRGERSKRAWLAGTVKQHMCALIDIPMMGQLLENEDHSRKDLT